METTKNKVAACLEKLRAGTLSENDLQNVIDGLESAETDFRKQSLLYVYSGDNSVFGQALSIFLIEDGKDREGRDQNGNFIYNNAHEAMQDGWRVIKFPEVSLLMQDQNTYGLGCEFVLERCR